MEARRKISRRQFLEMAALAAGIAALAGCQTPAAPTSASEAVPEGDTATVPPATPEPAPAKPVTISWWQYPLWEGITGKETAGLAQDDPQRAQYTAADWPNWAAQQFAKEYPGFNCSVELISWAEGRVKLTVAAATGAGRPHMFFEDGPVIHKFAIAKAVLPMEMSAEDREDYRPDAISWGTRDGTLWYIPWLGGSRMLMANRAIFRERGAEDLLPSEGDRLWTYEQFLEALKATTFQRGSENVYGFASDLAHFATHMWVDSFIWGYGARIFDESGLKVIINTPEAEEGMAFLADLENKYKVMAPGAAGLQEAEQNSMFYQCRLAVVRASHSSGSRAETAKQNGTVPNPEGLEVYPMMYPSALPDHKPGVFTTYMGYGQFDTGTPEEQSACAKFIAFLSNRQNGRAPAAGNFLPARRSAEDIYGDDQFMRYAMQALTYGHRDTLSPYFEPMGQFLNPMWQAVVSGELSPKEALAEAQERGNAFVAAEEAKATGS